jgi:hypothetical protein
VIEDHISTETADLRSSGAVTGLEQDLWQRALDPEKVARPSDEGVADGEGE